MYNLATNLSQARNLPTALKRINSVARQSLSIIRIQTGRTECSVRTLRTGLALAAIVSGVDYKSVAADAGRIPVVLDEVTENHISST